MLVKDVPTITEVKLPTNPFSARIEGPKEEFIRQYLESPRKKALYIHTPFCISKCRYCKWQSSELKNLEQLRVHYEETLPQKLQEFKEIFDNVIFDELYLGGGTPTVATPKMMNTLFDKIPNFDKIQNKCMESSPDTLKTEHVDMFMERDFNFLSIGIQSLDYEVMKRQNRPYVSHQEVANLSDYLNDRGIYFNLDMICYLDKGDVRDIPGFERDLDFLMKVCEPAAITIHQEHFAMQSFEKTHELMRLIRDKLSNNTKWMCVNSDLLDRDVSMDTMHRAEYKIVSRDYSYMHHLWDKYNLNLKEDYDVLSIGSTAEHKLFSFVGDTIYRDEENALFLGPNMVDEQGMFNILRDIRIRKGLQEA